MTDRTYTTEEMIALFGSKNNEPRKEAAPQERPRSTRGRIADLAVAGVRSAIPAAKTGLLGSAAMGASDATREAYGSRRPWFDPNYGTAVDFLNQRGLYPYSSQDLVAMMDERFNRPIMQSALRAKEESDAAIPETNGMLEEGFFSGVQSTAMNVPGILAAIATRNPAYALGPMGAISGGQAYSEGIAAGLSPEKASQYGWGTGGVEVGTEMIPMGWLLGDLAKRTPFMKMLGKQMLAEGLTEQVATAGQDALTKEYLQPEKSWGEYLAERPRAAGVTAIASTVGVGTTVPAVSAIGKAQDFIAEEAARRSGEMTPDQAESYNEEVRAIRAKDDPFVEASKRLEQRDIEASAPKAVEIKYDNPGGEWLAGKQATAEREMSEASDHLSKRALRGSVTAYTDGPVELPLSALQDVGGAFGESPEKGQVKYDQLTEKVENEGWNPSPILVRVNHLGVPYIMEGNNRVAVAKARGETTIPAVVNWVNGGENAEAGLKPETVAAISKPWIPSQTKPFPELFVDDRATSGEELEKLPLEIRGDGKAVGELAKKNAKLGEQILELKADLDLIPDDTEDTPPSTVEERAIRRESLKAQIDEAEKQIKKNIVAKRGYIVRDKQGTPVHVARNKFEAKKWADAKKQEFLNEIKNPKTINITENPQQNQRDVLLKRIKRSASNQLKSLGLDDKTILKVVDYITSPSDSGYARGVATPSEEKGSEIRLAVAAVIDSMPDASDQEITEQVLGVLNHETLHVLRDLGVFTQKEWDTLVRAAKSKSWHAPGGKARKFTYYQYAKQNYGSFASEEIVEEEAVADLWRHEMADPGGKERSKTYSILEKANKFLMEMVRGIRAYRDVVSAGARGEIGRRPVRSTPPLTERFSISAPVEVAIEDPNGGEKKKPLFFSQHFVRRNFDRWFGDSKVVNKDGLPKMVVHSTRAFTDNLTEKLGFPPPEPGTGIETFNVKVSNALGAHFGTPLAATDRALFTSAEDPNTLLPTTWGAYSIPGFLSIQNPLRLPDLGMWGSGNIIETLVDLRVFSNKEADYYTALSNNAEVDALSESYLALKRIYKIPDDVWEGMKSGAKTPWDFGQALRKHAYHFHFGENSLVDFSELLKEPMWKEYVKAGREAVERAEIKIAGYLKDALKAKGYDGVVYFNEMEGKGKMADRGQGINAATQYSNSIGDYARTDQHYINLYKKTYPQASDSYIIFEPSQFKSLFNVGSFNPNDPRHRFQVANPVLAEIYQGEWTASRRKRFTRVARTSREQEAENFWKFFKGSKVVSADGLPLIVSHSSKAQRDEVAERITGKSPESPGIDVMHTGIRGQLGTHFGTTLAALERVASQYSGPLDYGSDFNPVMGLLNEGSHFYYGFLNIKNPLRLPELGGWSTRQIAKILHEDLDLITLNQLNEIEDFILQNASIIIEEKTKVLIDFVGEKYRNQIIEEVREDRSRMGLENAAYFLDGTHYFDKAMSLWMNERYQDISERKSPDGFIPGEPYYRQPAVKSLIERLRGIEKEYGERENKYTQEVIKGLGYDGVVYLNEVEGIGPLPSPEQRLKSTSLKHKYPNWKDRVSKEYMAAFKAIYPEASDSYIIFDPNQFKSMFNIGTWDSNDPRHRFQIANPKYFSQTKRAVQQAPFDIARVSNWKKYLDGSAKKKELYWLNIEQFFAERIKATRDQNPKISRSELLSHIEDADVKIVPVYNRLSGVFLAAHAQGIAGRLEDNRFDWESLSTITGNHHIKLSSGRAGAHDNFWSGVILPQLIIRPLSDHVDLSNHKDDKDVYYYYKLDKDENLSLIALNAQESVDVDGNPRPRSVIGTSGAADLIAAFLASPFINQELVSEASEKVFEITKKISEDPRYGPTPKKFIAEMQAAKDGVVTDVLDGIIDEGLTDPEMQVVYLAKLLDSVLFYQSQIDPKNKSAFDTDTDYKYGNTYFSENIPIQIESQSSVAKADYAQYSPIGPSEELGMNAIPREMLDTGWGDIEYVETAYSVVKPPKTYENLFSFERKAPKQFLANNVFFYKERAKSDPLEFRRALLSEIDRAIPGSDSDYAIQKLDRSRINNWLTFSNHYEFSTLFHTRLLFYTGVNRRNLENEKPLLDPVNVLRVSEIQSDAFNKLKYLESSDWMGPAIKSADELSGPPGNIIDGYRVQIGGQVVKKSAIDKSLSAIESAMSDGWYEKLSEEARGLMNELAAEPANPDEQVSFKRIFSYLFRNEEMILPSTILMLKNEKDYFAWINGDRIDDYGKLNELLKHERLISYSTNGLLSLEEPWVNDNSYIDFSIKNIIFYALNHGVDVIQLDSDKILNSRFGGEHEGRRLYYGTDGIIENKLLSRIQNILPDEISSKISITREHAIPLSPPNSVNEFYDAELPLLATIRIPPEAKRVADSVSPELLSKFAIAGPKYRSKTLEAIKQAEPGTKKILGAWNDYLAKKIGSPGLLNSGSVGKGIQSRYFDIKGYTPKKKQPPPLNLYPFSREELIDILQKTVSRYVEEERSVSDKRLAVHPRAAGTDRYGRPFEVDPNIYEEDRIFEKTVEYRATVHLTDHPITASGVVYVNPNGTHRTIVEAPVVINGEAKPGLTSARVRDPKKQSLVSLSVSLENVEDERGAAYMALVLRSPTIGKSSPEEYGNNLAILSENLIHGAILDGVTRVAIEQSPDRSFDQNIVSILGEGAEPTIVIDSNGMPFGMFKVPDSMRDSVRAMDIKRLQDERKRRIALSERAKYKSKRLSLSKPQPEPKAPKVLEVDDVAAKSETKKLTASDFASGRAWINYQRNWADALGADRPKKAYRFNPKDPFTPGKYALAQPSMAPTNQAQLQQMNKALQAIRYAAGPQWLTRPFAPFLGEEAARELVDSILVKAYDRFLPVRRLVVNVLSNGGTIRDASDPVMKEGLFHRRSEHRLKVAKKNLFQPALVMIKKIGATKTELESLSRISDLAKMEFEATGTDPDQAMVSIYMYAHHAKERNAFIEKIRQTPELDPLTGKYNLQTVLQDGSGMTDYEADQILNWFRSYSKVDAVDDAAQTVWRIIKFTRRVRIDGDLAIDYEALRGTTPLIPDFDYYIPLRGFAPGEIDHLDREGDNFHLRTGRFAKVQGREDKRMKGRNTYAGNVVENVILQAEEAIIRSEKNRIAQAFVAFVRENRHLIDPADMHIQATVPVKPMVSKTTGKVVFLPDMQFAIDDNTFIAKENGRETYVKFREGSPVARALIRVQGLGDGPFDWAARISFPIVKFMSKLQTSLNLDFTIPNILRDIQTAMIQSRQYDKGAWLRIINEYRKIAPAMIAGSLDQENSATYQELDELSRLGGLTGLYGIKSLEDQRTEVRKELERLSGLQSFNSKEMVLEGLKASLGALEAINDMAESATRLAVYKAFKDQLGKEAAALMAKELTINFNRKGEWGPIFNALWMFWNAAAQGTGTMVQALSHKDTQKVALGIIIMGALQEMLMGMAGGDDEEGNSYYEKLSKGEPWTMERNMIFMIPGTEGRYAKIPMPLGWNIFHNLGRRMVRVAQGDDKPLDAGVDVTGMLFNMFDPFGSGESGWAQFSPSMLRPIADTLENKDFTGKPVRPQTLPFGTVAPPSQTYGAYTPEPYKILAEGLSRMTGGDGLYEPGLIEVYPDNIDHWVTSYGGGLLRFMGRTVDTMGFIVAPQSKEAQGRTLEVGQIPIVRGFAGKAGAYTNRAAYQDLVDSYVPITMSLKKAVETGDDKAINHIYDKRSDDLILGEFVADMERDRIKIRRSISEIQKDPFLTDADKAPIVKAYREEEEALMSFTIKEVERLRERESR